MAVNVIFGCRTESIEKKYSKCVINANYFWNGLKNVLPATLRIVLTETGTMSGRLVETYKHTSKCKHMLI